MEPGSPTTHTSSLAKLPLNAAVAAASWSAFAQSLASRGIPCIPLCPAPRGQAREALLAGVLRSIRPSLCIWEEGGANPADSSIARSIAKRSSEEPTLHGISHVSCWSDGIFAPWDISVLEPNKPKPVQSSELADQMALNPTYHQWWDHNSEPPSIHAILPTSSLQSTSIPELLPVASSMMQEVIHSSSEEASPDLAVGIGLLALKNSFAKISIHNPDICIAPEYSSALLSLALPARATTGLDADHLVAGNCPRPARGAIVEWSRLAAISEQYLVSKTIPIPATNENSAIRNMARLRKESYQICDELLAISNGEERIENMLRLVHTKLQNPSGSFHKVYSSVQSGTLASQAAFKSILMGTLDWFFQSNSDEFNSLQHTSEVAAIMTLVTA